MQTDVFQESSRSQKKIISVLYRIVLIAYSFILLGTHQNKFTILFIASYFVIYMVIYGILFGKDGFYSRLRLTNDFLFIGITIYGISEFNLYTYTLLFVPILNAQNHTGTKKSFLLYVYPCLILFYINDKFELLPILPFLVFFIINSFEKLKNKYQVFYNELNSSLDNFIIEENSLNKLHKIYQIIIPIFNKHSFFSRNLKEIICFKRIQDSLVVINGSKFVYESSLINLDSIFAGNKNLIKNEKISINNKSISENIILKVSRNSADYIFLLIPEEDDKLNLHVDKFHYPLLRPFFYRLINIFDFKIIQNEIGRKNFIANAKKVTYVNNAINSMHFTRNKLGPLKTYLSMIDDYEKSGHEKKVLIEPFLKEERKKLRSSLDEILSRADMILEKSNNPFNVLEREEYSFFSLLAKVREHSTYYLKPEKFHLILKDINIESIKRITYNDTGIDLVLSNWFSNVNKYKAEDKYGVELSEDERFYYITFFNRFINRNTKDIPDFIKDFNSNDRMAILKRQTHGLVEIKDFLEQMEITSEMYNEDDMLYFKISFQKN